MGFVISGGGGGLTPQDRADIDHLKGTITPVAGDEVTQTLAAYTEYRCTGGASGTANEGIVTNLTISMPQTVPDDYVSIIHFTTGSAPDPTHFSYPLNILMCGTDVDIETVTVGNTTTSKYAFDVQANTRYTIAFEWDGTYMRGFVTGVELI